MRAAVLMIAFVLTASTALAGQPQTGVYLSDDMGGQMLTGRFSESWVDPGSHGQVGNTLNAQSYDPAFGLGSQWRVWCASIALPSTLVSDTRNVDGTGEVTWRTEYSGGLFWFSADGPLPLDFPEFVDESCQVGTRTRGGWGSVTEIALRILGDCTVGTEATTWGAVKSLYGN